MKKTSHKGYIAPWSSQRETAGLMGAFLIFILSYPGHSEIFFAQTRHLFQQLLQLTFVFLGLVTPVAQSPSAFRPLAHMHHKFPAVASPAKAPVVQADLSALPMNAIQRQVTYIFEGKATLHDQPCPNASVLLRLTNGEQTVAQGTITGPDGSYRVQAAIGADFGDPVDWRIEAYTADFKKVEIYGRKIVERPEDQEALQKQAPIVVDAPVEFLVTLSK